MSHAYTPNSKPKKKKKILSTAVATATINRINFISENKENGDDEKDTGVENERARDRKSEMEIKTFAGSFVQLSWAFPLRQNN